MARGEVASSDSDFRRCQLLELVCVQTGGPMARAPAGRSAAPRWLWLAVGPAPSSLGEAKGRKSTIRRQDWSGLQGRRRTSEEQRPSVILLPSVSPFLATRGERAGEQRAVWIHGALSKGRHQPSSPGPSWAPSVTLG